MLFTNFQYSRRFLHRLVHQIKIHCTILNHYNPLYIFLVYRYEPQSSFTCITYRLYCNFNSYLGNIFSKKMVLRFFLHALVADMHVHDVRFSQFWSQLSDLSQRLKSMCGWSWRLSKISTNVDFSF